MTAAATTRERILLGILFRLLAGISWAIANGLVKWCAELGVGLVQTVFFRNAVACLVTAGVMLATAGPASFRTARPWMHAQRGLVGVLAIVLGFAAVRLAPLSEVTALGFAAPLWVTLLSWPMLRQRVSRTQWAAVMIGFAGVLVMVRPDPAHIANLGGGLALAAALFSALSTLAVAQLGRTEKGPTIVFYFLLFATLASALPLPFFWEPLSAKAWMALMLLGVLSAGVQTLFTQSVRFAPPAVVSPLDYVQLIWAGIIGWLIWSEAVRPATIVGGLIVACAGLFILYGQARRRRP